MTKRECNCVSVASLWLNVLRLTQSSQLLNGPLSTHRMYFLSRSSSLYDRPKRSDCSSNANSTSPEASVTNVELLRVACLQKHSQMSATTVHWSVITGVKINLHQTSCFFYTSHTTLSFAVVMVFSSSAARKTNATLQ